MKVICLLLLPLLCLLSCAEIDKSFKLVEEIKHTYHCDNISVSVSNNENIKVIITNCDCCKKSNDEQQLITDSIGMLIPKYYDKDIKSGEVDFESKNGFIVGSISTSQDYDMHLKK